ncbi:Uncharacterised protein [Yersinia enterocolitica]|nr:Uncharacterised protein [Yersinia enterocolitica]
MWRTVAFAPWRAAKHHRHRQHLNIQLRVIAMQIEIIVEYFYRFLLRGVVAKHPWAVIDKDMAGKLHAIDFQWNQWVGQILCLTLRSQSQ